MQPSNELHVHNLTTSLSSPPAVVILVQATVISYHVSPTAFSLDSFYSSHGLLMRMAFLRVNHSMVSLNAPTLGRKSEPFATGYKALHSLAFSLPFSFIALLTSLWPRRSSCCYVIRQISMVKPLHVLFPLPRTFHIQIFTWLTPWLKSGTRSHTLSPAGPSQDYLKSKTALPLCLYIFTLPITFIYYLRDCSFSSLTREGVPKGQVGHTVHSFSPAPRTHPINIC